MYYLSTALKTTVDERLQCIANILMLNANHMSSIGLFNGKMGIAIFLYHYAKYSEKEIYEAFAGELIDEIYNKINTDTPIDFEGGLTGIGWGFEYLIQKGFVEADRDEVLEDIDNIISLVKEKEKTILLQSNESLYNYGLYYSSRLGDEGSDDLERQVVNNLQRDSEILLAEETLFGKDGENLSTSRLNSIIYVLIEMKRKKLFPEKISKILSRLPLIIQQKVDLTCSWDQQSTLIKLLSRLTEEIDETSLKKQYLKLKSLLIFIDSKQNNINEIKISNFISAELHTMLYSIDFSDDEVYTEICRSSKALLKDEGFWVTHIEDINNDNLCLFRGLAGLGLALMNQSEKRISCFD